MNRNPKLYNAVMIKDLKLSAELKSLIGDQTQDMDLPAITKGWVADTIEMLKDTSLSFTDDEYDENVVAELTELARLMVEKRIQIIVL